MAQFLEASAALINGTGRYGQAPAGRQAGMHGCWSGTVLQMITSLHVPIRHSILYCRHYMHPEIYILVFYMHVPMSCTGYVVK